MVNRIAQLAIERIPNLQETSIKLKNSIHEAVMRGGEPARNVADVLHGTWLGHPLHPVLTDFTIGAWGIGALFDAVAVLFGHEHARQVGDTLAKTGTVAAVPTLITGLADYSTVQKPASSTATLHALLNDINFVLYLISIRERSRGNYGRGVFYSMLAVALMLVSAWLGGHLVYNHKVGVDHSEASGPDEWTPALEPGELIEGEPKRVDVEGSPVLLYRFQGRVHAIGAVCSHAGGPLEEGTFDGCYVQCPWHDSVIDVRDGTVKHGPATRTQPAFAVRELDGWLEVRQILP